MKETICKLRKKFAAMRRGSTLVELLGVMAVIAIISVIAVGGITAARDSANETSVQSDIRTFQTSIQQVLVQHPEIMKFTATNPTNAADLFVSYLNDQVEEQWAFERLTGNADSGGIAGTSIKRDAWGNPYGLYIYFDTNATTYTTREGTPLKDTDSCVNIAVVSAGKNSTGGPTGINGSNINQENRKLVSASEMVNNTDGVDDLGVIVRVLNGDVYTATFGLDKTTLGSLEDMQWIYGKPSATGGICYDFVAGTPKTATTAGSVDKYYDNLQVDSANQTLFGTWS